MRQLRGRRLLLGALLLASCAEQPPPVAPATTLRIAHEADVLSLDPAAYREAATQSVLSNIYEPLVRFDRDMRLAPALAVSWNALDEHTWLFELRKNVRFHDGTQLSATQVKAALERNRNHPGSGVRGQLANLDTIEATGEHTLRVKTRRRDPLLLNTLAYILIARDPGKDADPAGYVGTGPYRRVSWEQGKALEAAAFTSYWGGAPSIAHVRFVPIEEGEASIGALKRGEVDVLRYVPEELASELGGHPAIGLLARPGLTSYYLWFDTRPAAPPARNPFADLRVRQAVSLAIDRHEIIRGLAGSGVALDQLVQQGVFGHIGSFPALAHDAVKAKALLREAGYPTGFEVTLVHRTATSVNTVARLLQGMLEKAGIRLQTQSPDWREVVAQWQQGRMPFLLAGWRFESGDASSFLWDCVYTRDPARNLGSSNAGFSDPVIDRLIEENGEILGEANRLRQYERLMRLALEQLPLVPLYTRDNVYGVSRKVAWKPRLDGKLLAAEMTVLP